MIRKIKILFVLSLLLFVSMSAVSAMDDADMNITSSDDAVMETSDAIDVVSSAQDDTAISDSSDEVLSSKVITVNSQNYGSYFDKKGNVQSTVGDGDTVKLEGSFSKVNFIFNKKVNLEGSSSCSLSGCTVKLLSGASGSVVSNLIIRNYAEYAQGVCLDGADDCIVKNCFINNTGQSSYAVCLGNNANNNQIIDNHIICYGETYGHNTRSTPPLVLFGSHNNYIANNRVECDDANGIYFSNYGGGPFSGGESNYNTLFNNTVKYNVLPTSWSYGIQVMGSYNKIDSNTVIGAYRGISTVVLPNSYGGNTIINNRVVNLVGKDFSNNVPSGGENAIVGTYNSIIKNNRVENASIMASGSGISALDNSTVEDNYVEVANYAGKGISAYGNDIRVKNNVIFTVSGIGVFQQGAFDNLVVDSNNITSKSGVGVHIIKENNKNRPKDVKVINNRISTKAEYIINALDVELDSNWEIKDNVGGNVLTPNGTYNANRPRYEYNGSVHEITSQNWDTYIDDNGNLKSNVIKEYDTLKFVGTFANKEIKINTPVKITGNNPIFYNTTFNVISGGVWIENLIIINNKSKINNWGIVVNKVDDGVTIFNNTISVYDLKSAYAIYIVSSSLVDVINNTLFSSGDFLTYTLLSYSAFECRFINNTINTLGTGEVYSYTDEYCLDGEWICIDGQWYFSESNSVCIDGQWYNLEGQQVCIDGQWYALEGQKVCIDGQWYNLEGQQVCIDGQQVCLDGQNVCLDGQNVCLDGQNICLDGQQVSFDGSCLDGSHVVQELQRTYGILMLYSSDNEISRNKVNVSSKLNRTLPNIGNNSSTNTIIGIDLYYNSHNNIFSENEVFIKGNDNYIYGMGVLGYYTGHNAPNGQGASNNQFIDNKISLEGTYYITGIIVGDESRDTLIKNNVIDAKATNVTYGVTLEMSHKSTVESNDITLSSDLIYGLQAYASDENIIVGNDFNLKAKKIYGIAFNSNNNNVSNNRMVANSTGENLTFRELDSIKGENSGMLLCGNATGNIVEGNNITSTYGYAINVDALASGNVISDNYLVSQLGNANAAVNDLGNNYIYGNYVYLISGLLCQSEIQYLEFGDYTFTVSDELAEKLEGANVGFYIGDQFIGSANLKNGSATLNCRLDEDYTPAQYMIHCVVSKEDYRVTAFDSKLVITLGNLDVEVANISVKDGLNGKFSAKVTNALGKPISNVKVVFYRGSQPIGSAVTDNDGVATKITLVPKTLTGSFEIKAQIDESDYYLAAVGIGNLTIIDIAPVNIQVDNILSFGGILATLTDNNGLGLDSRKVLVSVGSKQLTLKTDSNGQITLPDVKVGSYTLSIIFYSDLIYESVNYNGKLSVLAPLSENKDFKVFYGNSVNYKVRVRGSDGNYVGANVNVAIKVNGKSYNVKTDKNGYASKSIKLGAGKYTITAEYNGYKVSNKITFKPTLTAKNIVKKRAKKIKFSAKLVDKNGKVLKNKKVSFKIKNKKYTAKTNKKGVATVILKKLKVGKYTITSSYGGCSIKNTIKIKK